MIHLKTHQELARMKEGGAYLAKIRDELVAAVAVGVTPDHIEKKAGELIKKTGGEPSFKRVPGYHWATCINVNDVVVHGIPNKIPFSEGDVVGVDVGLFYKGFHTDTSWTVFLENQKSKIKKSQLACALTDSHHYNSKINHFLKAGEKALEKGIAQVKTGNRIGQISQAMQKVIEGNGYQVVEELVGHGIGKLLHEDPEVPGMVVKPVSQTAVIKPGLAIAIEIIYTMGEPEIVIGDDNWTIRTKDGTIAGLFEKTVIVEDHGVFVVT